MHCTQCGQQLSNQAKFCTRCRAPQSGNAPIVYSSGPGITSRPPSAIAIYTVFSILLMLCGVFLIFSGSAIYAHPSEFAQRLIASGRAASFDEVPAFGAGMMLIGIICSTAAGSSWFFPRTRWGWILRLLVMMLAAWLCIFLPFSIIASIYWCKRETRDYYGVRSCQCRIVWCSIPTDWRIIVKVR